MSVPEGLERFLRENQVLCLATAADGQSYSAPVFYVYLPETISLAFLSDRESVHARSAMKNPMCSGAVFSAGKSVEEIQGVQIIGTVTALGPTERLTDSAMPIYSTYLDRFPAAKGRPSHLWQLACYWMKFTDNSRGFGFKETWSRP